VLEIELVCSSGLPFIKQLFQVAVYFLKDMKCFSELDKLAILAFSCLFLSNEASLIPFGNNIILTNRKKVVVNKTEVLV
jgi:hypothetical protein